MREKVIEQKLVRAVRRSGGLTLKPVNPVFHCMQIFRDAHMRREEGITLWNQKIVEPKAEAVRRILPNDPVLIPERPGKILFKSEGENIYFADG